MTETEKLLSYVKTRADLKYGGHYIILCQSGKWMGGFSASAFVDLSKVKIFSSLESLLNDMLQNEKSDKS